MEASSLAALERPRGAAAASNTVYKSGPLFISSKGLGWTSWKKRWFILTRSSLVFFKNDPGTLPQKGGEVNITLGGIDLNNSGSVVVREDKKLLTVLFPDGRDGRAFTLKAETYEDLCEWKTSLEQALAHAPNATLIMGHNGIFRPETNEASEGRDKRPLKSLVVGRPILLALEDIDGSPSFLEKALQFIENYGTKIEGILRQSADVEEVERRVQEYEQGKTEFSFDEDPHVIGDCIKHVLRELPSSPVSASCCTALLEAYRIESKEARISSLRSAMAETFPEPNRRLLQRILKMMHTISSHSHENRMSPSAVAACMAPLLLRPLLAGECDLEDEFDDSGEDNSAQLLAAANAANNAQAIITTLLEDYGSIFDEENIQRCSISTESHIGNSGPDDSSDDDNNLKNDYRNEENEVEPVTDDDDNERALSGKMSESSAGTCSDLYEYKGFVADDSDIESPRETNGPIRNSNARTDHLVRNHFFNSTDQQAGEQLRDDPTNSRLVNVTESYQSGKVLNELTHGSTFASPGLESSSEKSVNKSTPSSVHTKRSTFWGRGSARKLSTDGSFDSSGEDELAIQRLETAKNELRQRIAKEARGNAILQASLERRKQALHERRFSLEQDVSRLQEQLQAERDLRAALEVGLSMSSGHFSSHGVDSKTRAELEEIALAEADVARLKQKVAELHQQLNQQRQTNLGSFSDARDNHQYLQKRFLQQDFDSTLAFVNHERKQRHEENVLGADWRNSKGAGSFGVGNSRQPSRKQTPESKSSEDYGKMSIDNFSGVDSPSPSVPSTSRALDITEYPTWHFTSFDAPHSVSSGVDSSFRDNIRLVPMPDSYDLDRGLLLSVQAIQALLENKGPPVIVGIGGPSGSGKTSLAHKMANIVGCEVVSLESYFKSEQVKDFKHDDFSSLDLPLLSKNIADITNSRRTKLPVFDLETGTRCGFKELEVSEECGVIIFEGVYALHPEIRQSLDLWVAVVGGVHSHLISRVQRDKSRVGCFMSQNEIMMTVFPMFQQHIEPHLVHAHVKIRNDFDPVFSPESSLFVLKSNKQVPYQDILSILDSTKFCSSVQNFIDIYFRLSGLPANGQLSDSDCIRVRICEGRFAVLIREPIREGNFIVQPKVDFDISVSTVAGLLNLGYQAVAYIEASAFIYQDGKILIEVDHLQDVPSPYIQIKGVNKKAVTAAGSALKLDGSYTTKSYLQIVLERLPPVQRSSSGIHTQQAARLQELVEFIQSQGSSNSASEASPRRDGSSIDNVLDDMQSRIKRLERWHTINTVLWTFLMSALVGYSLYQRKRQ